MYDAVVALSIDHRVSILQFIRQSAPRKYPRIMAHVEQMRFVGKAAGVYYASIFGDPENGWKVEIGDLIENDFTEDDDARDCYGGGLEWWK